jgi:putative addiction module component (TIGR02574 family)
MPRENTAERVTLDALALEPEERAALAERLLESLEGHGAAVLSPAWREEVRRRREEIERGEVEAVPAEVVLGRMRAMLA